MAQSQALTPHHFEATVRAHVACPYLLYLPPGYEASHDKYPLLLFLHGAGERGTDLKGCRIHGLAKEIDKGRTFPFITLVPQCPEYQTWDIHNLIGLLDEIEKEYRIDKGREYVTGLSMGGWGTFALVAAQPKRFAAAAPICGGADPSLVPQLTGTPLWITHGTKDDTVAFEPDKKLADAIQAAGGDVRFTAVPDGGHDVWTDVYAGTELYEWLLQHRRG